MVILKGVSVMKRVTNFSESAFERRSGVWACPTERGAGWKSSLWHIDFCFVCFLDLSQCKGHCGEHVSRKLQAPVSRTPFMLTVVHVSFRTWSGFVQPMAANVDRTCNSWSGGALFKEWT